MCAVYCEGKRRFLPGNASAGVQSPEKAGITGSIDFWDISCIL